MHKKIFSNEQTSYIKLFFVFLTVSILFRTIFFFSFKDQSYLSSELYKALYIGLKFDLRASALLSIPFWFLGYVFKFVNWAFRDRNKIFFTTPPPYTTKALRLVFTVILTLYSLFYFLDLKYFERLQNRIGSSPLLSINKPLKTLVVILENSSILSILLLIILLSFFFFIILRFLVFRKNIFTTSSYALNSSWKAPFILFIITAGLIHGRLSQKPLNWKDAHFSSKNFISSLSLHPLLYLNKALKINTKNYDLNKVKAHYNLISKYLNVSHPNQKTLSFSRTIKPFMSFEEMPNIVVIMMNSISTSKTRKFGQNIQSTPFLDSLIPKSIFFDNFYSTSPKTSRSIFEVFTGIPDLNPEASFENPLLSQYYSSINGLTNYKKNYFLGDSTKTDQLQKILSQSIPDIIFLKDRKNSWKNSNFKLFKDAHNYLKSKPQKELNFTFIQTTKEKTTLKPKELTKDQLKLNGFKNNNEFNSLRGLDHALQEFFSLAQQETYFKNTLFIIYSDYKGNSLENLNQPLQPSSYANTPLLFYSPALLKSPQTISKIAHQPDLFPSILSITGNSYTNKTLGKNLFDMDYDEERFALTITNFSPPLKLTIHDRKWLSRGEFKNIKGLFPYATKNHQIDESKIFPKETAYRKKLVEGLFETTKYLYHHSTKPQSTDLSYLFSVSPTSIKQTQHLEISYQRKHPSKIALKTPNGKFYIIHSKEDQIALIPHKKFKDSINIKVLTSLVRGINPKNNNGKREYVFKTPGIYTFYMSNDFTKGPDASASLKQKIQLQNSSL